jgi:hypothetical protein
MFDVTLQEQEEATGATFDNELVMTKGFKEKFEPFSVPLALETLQKIIKERVQSEQGADYLQVAFYKDNKFWIMDDECYVTFLLPEEY